MHLIKQCPQPSVVIPQLGVGGFKAKGSMIQNVLKFNGQQGETAYSFLRDYIVVCAALKEDGQLLDHICLGMFTFALTDQAKRWLSSLPPQSITEWPMLQKMFLDKFFPQHLTITHQEKISQFRTNPKEKLFEAWEHFKGLINACPYHGYSLTHLA